MHPAEVELTPHQRRREIAAILAADILGLRIRPVCPPGSATPGPKCGTEQVPDSLQKPLALPAPPSPHGPAG